MTDQDKCYEEIARDSTGIIWPEWISLAALSERALQGLFKSVNIVLAAKEQETKERCAQIADKEAESLEISGPTEASIVARYIAQNIRALETKS